MACPVPRGAGHPSSDSDELTTEGTVRAMRCWICQRRWPLPWACGRCRRGRRTMRRDYPERATRQDSLRAMTIPPKH